MGHKHLGSQTLGLDLGAFAELGARDPRGEPEVVLDARCRRGLPARGYGVDDGGREPFCGSVDGGRQAGGSGADYQQIEQTA